MQIKEISNVREIEETTELFAKNYENFDAKNHLELVENLLKNGYKLAAIFDEKNSCVAAIGARISQKIQHGKILEIEDFLIAPEVGENFETTAETLLHWAQELAKKSNCHEIAISIKTKNTAIQKVFSQRKFVLDEFLFRK